MLPMLKKLFSIVLSVAMLLCLIACDANNGENPSEPSNQPTENISWDTLGKEGVFNTKGVSGITLYRFYGGGTGSKVPTEYMVEIITWLNTFEIGNVIEEEILPPGTNTNYVEITYQDGTVFRNGWDTIEIDGVLYELKRGEAPECFSKILSHCHID